MPSEVEPEASTQVYALPGLGKALLLQTHLHACGGKCTGAAFNTATWWLADGGYGEQEAGLECILQ